MDVSSSAVKRKRASNWVEEDKILLQELVRERVSEIENKNTDTNTNQKKKKAWMELEESFNNMCKGSKRNLSQLKSQWTLTKIQAKKEVASHRRELHKTGGGPQPPEQALSENDITVWLPNEFIVDTNEFDSDLVYEIPPAVNNSSPAATKTISSNAIFKEVDEEVIEKPLAKKKKRSVVNTKVADEKIAEVVKFDIQCRQELHRLQVENEEKKFKCQEELHILQVANEEKKARNLDFEYQILKEKYANLKE